MKSPRCKDRWRERRRLKSRCNRCLGVWLSTIGAVNWLPLFSRQTMSHLAAEPVSRCAGGSCCTTGNSFPPLFLPPWKAFFSLWDFFLSWMTTLYIYGSRPAHNQWYVGQRPHGIPRWWAIKSIQSFSHHFSEHPADRHTDRNKHGGLSNGRLIEAEKRCDTARR